MGKSVVSWSEKYDIANAKGHEIKSVRKDMMGMKAGQKMLIATPKMVADIIATIPHGQIKDTSFLRAELAKQTNVDVVCPLTTGIFVRIICEASNEDVQNGASLSEVTPFWRVLGEKAPVRKKLSFDLEPYLTQQLNEAA